MFVTEILPNANRTNLKVDLVLECKKVVSISPSRNIKLYTPASPEITASTKFVGGDSNG